MPTVYRRLSDAANSASISCMNEKQTIAKTDIPTVRPTKKQRELLVFIDAFITAHGYSPSYREIMSGLGYNSVATVALHVRSLIKRGHLVKRDYSARSLELTHPTDARTVTTNQVSPSEEKWLVDRIEHVVAQAERTNLEDGARAAQALATLVAALQILGLEAAAQSFQPRLARLKQLAKQAL